MSGTKVRATFVKVDKGLAARIEIAKKLGGGDPHVRVGVFAGAGSARDGGLTNVEIAAVHEYGAPEAGIPERSFIRATFDKNRQKYASAMAKLLPRVTEGKLDVRAMFDMIGQMIVADINAYVRQGAGVPPPLAAATIAAKGSSRPLIDTGRMLAAITYVTLTENHAS